MADETDEERWARFQEKTCAPAWLENGAAVMAPHGKYWVPSIAVDVNGRTAYVDTREDYSARFQRKGRLMALADLRVLKSSPFAR